MTNLEKKAIERAASLTRDVTVLGPTYDENFRQTSKGDNPALLSSNDYRLGWQRAHEQFEKYLQFILTASRKELIQFVGKDNL